LFVEVLLLLKWEQVVDPFDDEKPFKKRQGEGACMEMWLIDHIEDLWVPVMMATKVLTILRQSR
jgi:hypothetical protein